MNVAQGIANEILEVKIIGASALIEAEELLDHESPDYFRGFIQGYTHCLKLADKLDAITSKEELQ